MTTLALQPQIQQTALNSLSLDELKNWDSNSLVNVLERVIRIVESGVPPAALAMALQIWYRTLSGNTFTESLQSVTERAHFSRNYALKGLKLLQELNIIDCTKRRGQTDEYEFTPIDQWREYLPPIPIKDDRTKTVVKFPLTRIQETVDSNITEPIPTEDVPIEDTNNVVVINKFLEELEQQQEVQIPHGNTLSIWRSHPDGTRYAQIPPIYDQSVGVEIQRQIDFYGLTPQAVVGRAIAFSKVPLLLLEMFSNLGKKLLDGCTKVVYSEQPQKTKTRKSQPESDEELLASLQLQKVLESMGVNLVPKQLQKCLRLYGEDVMLNAALHLKQTGALTNKANPTGYFLGCLKNGMGQTAIASNPSGGVEEVEGVEEIKPRCSTTEVIQAAKQPIASFSHAETNPRTTVASLIIQGLYHRAAIVAKKGIPEIIKGRIRAKSEEDIAALISFS